MVNPFQVLKGTMLLRIKFLYMYLVKTLTTRRHWKRTKFKSAFLTSHARIVHLCVLDSASSTGIGKR